jgi:hypothetical protein
VIEAGGHVADQLTNARVEARARSSPTGRWAPPVLLGLGLGLAIFLLYYLAYPFRHLTLPMGFDPPYYVWRGQYLASQGLGNGGFAGRPGYPLLSVLMGSATGLPQLQLVSVLSMVLVSLLARAVGAFAAGALGTDRWRWAVTVAVTGVVVGPAHLVGENLSNTLNLIFEIAALVPLAWAVGGRRGFWAAVALLVSAGVAHWDFLVTFGAVLFVAVLLAMPSAGRAWAEGAPLLRTEAGLLAGVGALVAAIMGVLVAAVLRAPVVTIDVGQDRVLYWKKFTRDLARLSAPAAAGLMGGWAVPALDRRWSPQGDRPIQDPGRAFAGRIVGAWTLVMAVGMLAGATTLKLPPARFLALLVALPGALVTSMALWMVARWVGGHGPLAARPRRRAIASGVVAIVALVALALPGALRWYRYPVLLKDRVLQQAEVAGRYLEHLPPGQPVVFALDYFLAPFPNGPVLGERSIRIGVPAERQPDVHFFVGTVDDLLAGRRTPPPNDRLRVTTAQYWDDVRDVLAQAPPVLVLRDLAGTGFEEAEALGARPVGPGVEVLRGGAGAPSVPAPSAVQGVPPGFGGVVWGLAILLLLGVAGAGWTRAMLAPGSSPEAFVSMAPVVGAAALVLGGLLAAEAGIQLGGVGGVVTYALVTAGGVVASFRLR